jgi:hypothetical protein
VSEEPEQSTLVKKDMTERDTDPKHVTIWTLIFEKFSLKEWTELIWFRIGPVVGF